MINPIILYIFYDKYGRKVFTPLFLPQLTRFDDTIKVAFKPLIIKFIIPYVFYTFKLYS